MEITMNSIGERIKARRKELRLTQTDIYNKCGISSGALSQIENGSRVPSVILFYSLSQVLDCDVNYLITGQSSNSKSMGLSENEENILRIFRKLNQDAQDEIMEFMELKLRRQEKGSGAAAKSSLYTEDGSGDMVG